MAKQKYIYRLRFITPPTDEGVFDYYFSSLAAIYDVFTAKQVGCGAQHLYNCKVSEGNSYKDKKALVTREVLHLKEQANPHSKIMARTNKK